MPGLKKVYGALVGAVSSDLSTFFMGFDDLLLLVSLGHSNARLAALLILLFIPPHR